MNFLNKQFTFDRVVRLIIGVVIAIVIIYALRYFKSVLLPFFIAWLLAYLLYPMVTFVRVKLRFKSNALSVVTVLTVLIGAIVSAVWFLVPLLISETLKLKNMIFKYAENTGSEIIPHSWESFLQQFISASNIGNLFDEGNIVEMAREFFPHAWRILNGSFSVMLGVFVGFIVLLYLFFILKDYKNLSDGFLSLIPKKQRNFVSNLMKDMELTMNRYYRRQALVAMIVGVLFCIGFSIIGLPLALVMGLLIGFLNLIPYMQVLGIPPTILLMLLRVMENGQSPWWPLTSLALVYIIVQIIQDGFLVPNITGKAMGLKPAVVLLSLSVWGVLLGVLGMVIALPATTLLTAYYKRFILNEKTDELPEEISPPVGAVE
ncbi:MAG: AI-2E family transporter [Dysgonamonadaceae bacterium]|jgi:predicted PurR-regulated permease PerM|nr:AI-2E family transporter [Dysgonamonadaceae bacterium]